jgi:hypothetical protein
MFLFSLLKKSAVKLEQKYLRQDKQLRFVIPNDKDPVFYFFDMENKILHSDSCPAWCSQSPAG